MIPKESVVLLPRRRLPTLPGNGAPGHKTLNLLNLQSGGKERPPKGRKDPWTPRTTRDPQARRRLRKCLLTTMCHPEQSPKLCPGFMPSRTGLPRELSSSRASRGSR